MIQEKKLILIPLFVSGIAIIITAINLLAVVSTSLNVRSWFSIAVFISTSMSVFSWIMLVEHIKKENRLMYGRFFPEQIAAAAA